MSALSAVADAVLNTMIVALAGWLAWLAIRRYWSPADEPTQPDPEPVDPRYWDVLAEARAILESE